MGYSVAIFVRDQVVSVGLTSVFIKDPEISVLYFSDTIEALFDDSIELNPSIWVIGLDSGPEAERDLDRLQNFMAAQIPTIILSHYDNPVILQRAVGMGVRGFVSKRSGTETILEAVHALAAGQCFLDPILSYSVWDRLCQGPAAERGLSDREFEVLRLVSRGETAKQIARKLNLSPKTVEKFRANGMVKLKLQSRAELIAYAAIHNWTSP